jgi:hypothetical protein
MSDNLEPKNEITKKDNSDKWEFEDYAFTLTGIIVVFLLIGPDLILSWFGISILGGSLGNTGTELLDNLDYGYGYDYNTWSLTDFRAMSPMLFLLTTSICFIKDTIDARKDGGYTGSMFTHTFESLLEDSIYMVMTTAIIYTSVLTGTMYASWLAGPITWVLFVFLFPVLRKKKHEYDSVDMPWILLALLTLGVIIELITGGWIAFPLSWLIICTIKLILVIRDKILTIDDVFNLLYYSFSVILMTLGITMNFWITSWLAFPVAIAICWILNKFSRFKKIEVSEIDK